MSEKRKLYLPVAQFRAQLAARLRDVENGCEIILTQHKSAIARVSAIEGLSLPEPVQEPPRSPKDEGPPLPPEYYAARYRHPSSAGQINQILSRVDSVTAERIASLAAEVEASYERNLPQRSKQWELLAEGIPVKKVSMEDSKKLEENPKHQEIQQGLSSSLVRFPRHKKLH